MSPITSRGSNGCWNAVSSSSDDDLLPRDLSPAERHGANEHHKLLMDLGHGGVPQPTELAIDQTKRLQKNMQMVMGDADGRMKVLRNTVSIGYSDSAMVGRRLVQKTGQCNVTSRNVTRRQLKFLSDLFSTAVEMRWRYHVVLFVASFVTCWLTFASIYLSIVQLHGDIDHRDNVDWVPCIDNVVDFSSAVLYSFETQTTIGYGTRVINSVCHVGVLVAMLQIFSGTLINVIVTGLVFAKISRPKSRRRTLVFSRCAVVCRRDGQYQLMFRVGDMRTRSHLVATSVRALLIRNILTTEGERVPLCQFSLALETDTGHHDSYVFLAWPVTVVHRIDAASPLWEMSAEQLRNEHFEIVVILEGTVELTGTTTQVLTSYLPSEIRWGECLVPLIAFHKDDGRYCIDFTQFHSTSAVRMPSCSARDWSERCHSNVDHDGPAANESGYNPISLTSATMVRSVSFPSQPVGQLLGSWRKRPRKAGI